MPIADLFTQTAYIHRRTTTWASDGADNLGTSGLRKRAVKCRVTELSPNTARIFFPVDTEVVKDGDTQVTIVVDDTTTYVVVKGQTDMLLGLAYGQTDCSDRSGASHVEVVCEKRQIS